MAEPRFLCQVNVRAHGEAAARVGHALGLVLPTQPNTVTTGEDCSALWLGPDEWLIVADDVAGAGAIESAVRAAFTPDWGSVVDVSGNRVALDVAGPSARDVLATGCSLDLHPRRFGVGRCAQTLLARTGVIVWQSDDVPTFRLLVRTSYARHLGEWLADATAADGPLP
ncbi:MAG: sarcosine oxidase subunit gamma [Chloroflexota bacterium]|nr:sarcosine oxidase subunit gamma [Chloroflexota bacterium]